MPAKEFAPRPENIWSPLGGPQPGRPETRLAAISGRISERFGEYDPFGRQAFDLGSVEPQLGQFLDEAARLLELRLSIRDMV